MFRNGEIALDYVSLPIKYAKHLQLHAGSKVNITIENDRIIIESPKYDLNKMLDDITPQNMHQQLLDDMQLKGEEEW